MRTTWNFCCESQSSKCFLVVVENASVDWLLKLLASYSSKHMVEPIAIAISFPFATNANANAKPKKFTALVSLVNVRRLSVLKSVAQKRRLLSKPPRFTIVKRRLARLPTARLPRRIRKKPRMKSVSRGMQNALGTRNLRHRRNDRRSSPTHARVILKPSRKVSGRTV